LKFKTWQISLIKPKHDKNRTILQNYKKAKLALGFSILIIGLYLSFIDNSVLNNGILGAGILLAASQTQN
jgi:hypothetical protein